MTSKRIAVVTDAGQGIARTIALRLADDGFDVAVSDVEVGELVLVANEIKSKGRQCSIHVADVSMEDSVKKLVEDVVKEHGGLDVMVASASLGRGKPILKRVCDMKFAVVAGGTFLCYKYASQQMIKQGHGGRIIGASSLSGQEWSTSISLYCRTKFAIRGFTKAAAVEFGRHGITVNALGQALDHAGNGAKLCDRKDMLTSRTETAVTRYNEMPTEVASLVSYLASKDSYSITGQMISYDGAVDYI